MLNFYRFLTLNPVFYLSEFHRGGFKGVTGANIFSTWLGFLGLFLHSKLAIPAVVMDELSLLLGFLSPLLFFILVIIVHNVDQVRVAIYGVSHARGA